jgi:rRNA maturation RNase YbeY
MISFSNLIDKNVGTLPEPAYKKWLKKVIHSEGKKIGDIQYIFCDDDYLLKINTTYLNHDTLTDIITFSTSDNEAIISGDIFISIDRIIENSDIHSSIFNDELSRVIVHGVLHLVGYDDHSHSDKKIMRNKEDYYLLLQAGLF